MKEKSERYAYRDLKICTKDCLCLFVCPTGATDNETGQIGFDKCIGCGNCAAACPSRAISMLPRVYPKQKVKDERVVRELFKLADSKIEQIKTLKYLMSKSSNDDEKRLYKALIHSNKVIIEDLMRESGYMLPQSKYTFDLLTKLSKLSDESLKDLALGLLDKINFNE